MINPYIETRFTYSRTGREVGEMFVSETDCLSKDLVIQIFIDYAWCADVSKIWGYLDIYRGDCVWVSFFNRLVGLPYEGTVQERAGLSDWSRVWQKWRGAMKGQRLDEQAILEYDAVCQVSRCSWEISDHRRGKEGMKQVFFFCLCVLSWGNGWLLVELTTGDGQVKKKRRLQRKDREHNEEFCFELDKYEMHIRHPLEILSWRWEKRSRLEIQFGSHYHIDEFEAMGIDEITYGEAIKDPRNEPWGTSKIWEWYFFLK